MNLQESDKALFTAFRGFTDIYEGKKIIAAHLFSSQFKNSDSAVSLCFYMVQSAALVALLWYIVQALLSYYGTFGRG